jgi:ligand-binding SRPBCC domain-containing protein
MPVIKIETKIEAPIERVFDLACSIDLHQQSMGHTQERAIGGVTTGLIDLGETVTWEAVHFGIKQRLTSKITVCERPSHLQDIMVNGAFKGFTHDHFLSETASGTLMKDVFDFTSPCGALGVMADYLFLENYMTGLLKKRNEVIKQAAESEDWRKFLI